MQAVAVIAASRGIAVSATFKEARGPQIQVTGAKGRLKASTLVAFKRFTPLGSITA
jgi:hypothetical protein